MELRRIRLVLLAGACLMGWAGRAMAADAPGCDVAGAAAERQYDVPSGLLRAIGRVESGRRDPASGRVVPWAWTINAEGRGHLYESAAEALGATRALQASGVASIDVGCFQVNLVHHPQAFASLEEGFDPVRNAEYAARFLAGLRARLGSWEAAVGAYHSATPERGNPYRDRVLAGWSRDGGPEMVALGASAPMPLPGPVAPVPFAMRVVTWAPNAGTPSAGGMRVWTPSAAGMGATVIRMTRG